MSRSTVDFPQPDGPRMAMNSPLFGTSSTENVTSRMTVNPPNRFVTARKSTTLGAAPVAPAGSTTSVLDDPVRKQPPLKPEQEAIDAERQQADDDENQDDVL